MRKEESRKAKKEQEELERRRQRRTEILPPKKKKSQRKKERRRRFWHIMVSYWVYHIAQLRSSSQNRVWNNKLKRKHQESLEMETTFRGASNTPGTRRTKFIVATIHRYFVGSTRTWKLVLSENMLYFQVMACSDFRSTKLYIYICETGITSTQGYVKMPASLDQPTLWRPTLATAPKPSLPPPQTSEEV